MIVKKIPQDKAFKVMTHDLYRAMDLATNYRKQGGCFLKTENGFMVMWLPNDYKDLKSHAW